jgi:chorismate mutase
MTTEWVRVLVFVRHRVKARPARAAGAAASVRRKFINVFFAFAVRLSYQCGQRGSGSDAIAALLRVSMSKSPAPAPQQQDTQVSLQDLRQEIDRIDEAMHGLLMERGQIIDRLIAVKKTEEVGSAFRPAREAGMMRRLVERHKGMLPLDTVESIWRVIISTFTYVQAPFSMHADLSAGDSAMRDSARFHFGFTVPFVPHFSAAAAVEAVAKSKGDLALVSATDSRAAWWTALEPANAPKIIARLPFLERADHPAALPVFVISRVADDAFVTEVEMVSIRVSGWSAEVARAISPIAEVVAVPDTAFDGAVLLVSITTPDGLERLKSALIGAGASLRSSALVGSHASRYRVPANGVHRHV